MCSSKLARRLALGLGALVVLLIVAVLVVGWKVSELVQDQALLVKHEPSQYEVEVVAVDEGQITLRSLIGTDLSEQPETIGLEWPEGYASAGRSLDGNVDTVTRKYTLLEGLLEVGDRVRFDKFAFPGDPQRAHGIPFQETTFASPLGELAAWHVAGTDDTWAIFVHGMDSNRRDALRMLPVMVEAGLPSMVITYRNDAGAPADPSGYYQYGRTEWEDLEAAVAHALGEGASDVLLVGYSMGGAIVASFLGQSPLAGQVAGVVLDSPMLDFGATIDLGAERRNLPGLVTGVAKWIAAVRFDVDWGALDYLSRADGLSVPILLFHGDADTKVPLGTSEALAERRPDIVTYLEFDGAAHVAGWNVDPERYENAVAAFVERVAR